MTEDVLMHKSMRFRGLGLGLRVGGLGALKHTAETANRCIAKLGTSLAMKNVLNVQCLDCLSLHSFI